MVVMLTIMISIALSLGMMAGVEADALRGEMDLQPPQIKFGEDNITVVREDRKLEFTYTVSDEGFGGSEILRTAVLLYRTPRDGEGIGGVSSECIPFDKIYDDITGLPYEIIILLRNIDGVEGTADDNGLVDVTATGVEEASLITETGKYGAVWVVEGNFTFRTYPNGSLKIYEECRYYMVVVAVDYYGNARWEVWDVTEYVHQLADQQASETRMRRTPRIWTQNIYGKVEPRGTISHHYILDGEPHVPWIESESGEYQRCFTLNMALGGHTIRIEELGVEAKPETTACGIFILRCYGLWRYGTLTITVDGEARWRIVFGYTIGIYGLLALLILAPVPLVALYGPPLWRRRGEE